jgi:glycosyltransferase involved in cell wall biosynthesis
MNGCAKRLYKWLAEAKTLRGATAFHFLSEEERERGVVGRVLKEDEVVVSPNVPPELPSVAIHDVLAGQFGDLSSRRVVLHLGRLHPIKGIDLQIRALALIPEAERPMLLLVGPDCGALRELRQLARRERVEEWVLAGSEVYGQERFGLLAEADLVLLTSVYDCNPVVAVEAMAVGGAVLATEGCGLSAAAQFGAAVVVRRCSQEVAVTIRRLLAAGDRLAQLRQRARQYVEVELNPERVVEPLLNLYERIVACRQRG